MNIKILNDAASYKTFEITLEGGEREKYFSRAAAVLSKKHPLKGFRPGQAPFDILATLLPQKIILEEAGREILAGVLPEFFQIQKERTLGAPLVEFKKFQRDCVVFLITLASWPSITFKAYHQLKVERKGEKVEENEVDQVLDYLKNVNKAHSIDDAFARSLEHFENLDQLKTSIRERILCEKNKVSRERARVNLLEKIRESCIIEIAPFVIEREAQKLIQYQEDEVKASGTSKEEYLKMAGKSEKDFVDETKDLAKKRLEHFLILNEIAKSERIAVSDQEVAKRVNKILSTFAQPRHAKKELNPETLKNQVHQQLLQEKVFSQVLDKQIITV